MPEKRTIALAEIMALVGELRDKMNRHRDAFTKNEALVRYALIDPLLRALGWDTEDPDQVRPEYSTGAGRPDYALIKEGRPVAFLGAKALGREEDLGQHISYCVSEGVPYFITTDGDRWEVYDTFKPVRLQEKKVTDWVISKDEPASIAIRALAIANIGTFGREALAPMFPPKAGGPEGVEKEGGRKDGATHLNYEKARTIVLEVLRDANGPMKRTDIMSEVSKRFHLTEYDKARTRSGQVRWKKHVAWALHYQAREGNIRNVGRGLWVITDRGKKAQET